jgi:hypothetical protein
MRAVSGCQWAEGNRGVRVHVHGHIHRCFGRVDRHFNVASGGMCRAMIIDPETLDATVEKGPEDPA